MTDELTPVRCGCGGEAIVILDMQMLSKPAVEIKCNDCGIMIIRQTNKPSEAIEAWNKAMGERTAKATRKPEAFFYRCECGYGLCCEKNEMNYCPQCGCRLIWGDDDE